MVVNMKPVEFQNLTVRLAALGFGRTGHDDDGDWSWTWSTMQGRQRRMISSVCAYSDGSMGDNIMVIFDSSVGVLLGYVPSCHTRSDPLLKILVDQLQDATHNNPNIVRRCQTPITDEEIVITSHTENTCDTI